MATCKRGGGMRAAETTSQNHYRARVLPCKKGGGMRAAETKRNKTDHFPDISKMLAIKAEGQKGLKLQRLLIYLLLNSCNRQRIERAETSRNLIALSLRTAASKKGRGTRRTETSLKQQSTLAATPD